MTALGCARGRREAHLPHQLGRVGGKENLFGDALVIDIALDLSPTLHLRQHPDREGLPGEWIKVDPIGHALHRAETVGERAGEHLFDHGDGLVEVVGRRDRFGDLLAVLRLGGKGGGVDDCLEQRRVCVGRSGHELLGC